MVIYVLIEEEFKLTEKREEPWAKDSFSVVGFKLKTEYSAVVKANGSERKLACKKSG